MKVLLISTWSTGCGIAEHAWYLKAAVEAEDPAIEIDPCPKALDPSALGDTTEYDVLHLNYQAGLLGRYSPTIVSSLARLLPVVVTYHDTGVPNSEQCRAVCAAATRYVVHEPADDLGPNGYYWRMGVPGPAPALILSPTFKAWVDQPVLGSIGFPFGWKNFDLLAELTRRLGWALLLIAPNASPAQVQRWHELNPASDIRTDFVPRREALSLLTACDATAFPYVTHNTGQSAAILQGIAARKPVLAFSTCRQFRALLGDPLGNQAIRWADTVEALEYRLLHDVPLGRTDPLTVALAEQESWARLGRKYATLYYEVTRG